MGFTTNLIALAILPKPSAVLSIAGSAFIAHNVCFRRRRRKWPMRVNHWLLLTMSLGDIVGSICFFFGAWPVPAALSDRIYGASGTRGTCTAQGFFLLLGMPLSFVGSACLSVSYLLAIRQRWTEDRLRRKALPWFALSVAFVSFVGAFTALAMDIIHPRPFWCWIGNPVNGDHGEDATMYAWVLGFVPLWLCFFVSIASMAVVYFTVSGVEGKSSRWRAASFRWTNQNQNQNQNQNHPRQLQLHGQLRVPDVPDQEQGARADYHNANANATACSTNTAAAVAVAAAVTADADADANADDDNKDDDALSDNDHGRDVDVDELHADGVGPTKAAESDAEEPSTSVVSFVHDKEDDSVHVDLHVTVANANASDRSIIVPATETATAPPAPERDSNIDSSTHILKLSSHLAMLPQIVRESSISKGLAFADDQTDSDELAFASTFKSRQVASQAYFYAFAFVSSWTTGTVLWLMSAFGVRPPYWLLVVHSFVTPLQGFFNALVFVRPRYMLNRRNHPEMSLFRAAVFIDPPHR